MVEDHLQKIIRRTSEYRSNSIVIGPGLGLGPEKGIWDETKKTVYFIFSPASPSNHLLEAFYSTARPTRQLHTKESIIE